MPDSTPQAVIRCLLARGETERLLQILQDKVSDNTSVVGLLVNCALGEFQSAYKLRSEPHLMDKGKMGLVFYHFLCTSFIICFFN